MFNLKTSNHMTTAHQGASNQKKYSLQSRMMNRSKVIRTRTHPETRLWVSGQSLTVWGGLFL